MKALFFATVIDAGSFTLKLRPWILQTSHEIVIFICPDPLGSRAGSRDRQKTWQPVLVSVPANKDKLRGFSMHTQRLSFLRLLSLAVTPAMLFTLGEAQAAGSCVAPPALSSPIVYDGKCPGESGFPKDVKAGGRDVYVKLPTGKSCSTGFTIDKGRNIRITGGHFSYADSLAAVVTVRDSSGTTFIDGLNIDVRGRSADAIRTFNHKGRLIVQNTYVKGIGGTLNGTHGDLVHAQNGGPLQELTLQNVTGVTGYQGLFVPYRPGTGHGTRKLRLDRVNVAYDPAVSKRSLKLLYLGSADNSTDRVPDLGSTFSSVHADGSFWDIAYYKTVYAEPRSASSCASFDSKHKISGQVCGGKPSGGDYAPPSQVGRSYNRGYFCN